MKKILNIQTTALFIIGFLVGIIGLGLFYEEKTLEPTQKSDSEEVTTEENIAIEEGKTNEEKEVIIAPPAGGNIEIIEVPTPETLKTPDLNRSVNFGPAYQDEETKNIVLSKIVEARAKVIEEDYTYISLRNLGSLYSTAQDYEAALEVYEFLASAVPNISLTRLNLGSLYHFHIKNFELAEINYLKAIELDPENTLAYMGLHQLYLDAYKIKTSSAEDILVEGLVALPQNIDFLALLAKYHTDKGNTEEAKNYYGRAIISAEAAGKADRANAFKEKLALLE